MNELREKIAQIPLRLPENAITKYYSLGDGEIDAILDAVIAALPFASADDEEGYIMAISEVRDILQSAKENTQ